MEIAEIKARLTLSEVIKHYGYKADKQNRIHCPFHEDKTPSMQLYWKTHTAYCFSSNCPTHGHSLDVIDFVMHQEKCTKHEAIGKAIQLLTSDSPAATPAPALTRPAILTKMFLYFTHAVHNSKPARDYLAHRGLDYTTLAIGYNTGQFHHGDRKEDALIASCVQVGLLHPFGNNTRAGGQAYKPFAKYCLVFALRNRAGQVSGLYFRSTVNEDNSKHYYLKDSSGLYPQYPDPATERLIVTEAIIDCATLLQMPDIAKNYGLLSAYGTNRLNQEMKTAISELPQLQEIIFAFDNDEAGNQAVAKYSQELQALLPGLLVSQLELPEKEDVNSLIQSHEAEVFTHLLQSRKPALVKPAAILAPAPEIPFPAPSHGNGRPPKENRLQVISSELLLYHHSPLQISVLGGVKLTGLDKLRVTLKIVHSERSQLLPVRHNLDLYHAQQTELLLQKITENLQVNAGQTAQTFEGLTTALEDYRRHRLEAQRPQPEVRPTLTDPQQQAAIDYLKGEQLMERTQTDIGKSGLIGEEANRLIAFLVYTSRKRESPLQLMCLGASGTGKTYLQEKIGELIPSEDKLEITTLSENAFYYFGQEDLKHKLILIEDLDGAQDVLYPLRELQSKKQISKTVVLKDSKGNLKTVTLKVEGPVCVSGCTTREKLYEDNANRCILLEIDTGKAQDAAVMDYQRKVSAGLINRPQEARLKQVFQHGQQLLKAISVRNPYAPLIHLPEAVFKPRRTISLLLGFIETITFYHQYQCAVKKDPTTGESYIETTPDHIQWAFTLLQEVLFRKSDELTGATRHFLESLKIHLYTHQLASFVAADIRVALRMNPHNLKRYVQELLRYGYVKAKGNRFKGYEYHLTSPQEYEVLKSSIQADLQAIMDKIHYQSGSLDQ